MNIYETFIKDTGARKPVLNTKEILQRFKTYLQSIEASVISSYKQLNEIENKLSTNMYTIDYIKEYMAKTKESMNKNVEQMFNKKIEAMESDLKILKERALFNSGDAEISKNNIIKLQTVLPNLSIEDKELLFENSKDKDPNVLEVLYMNVKGTNQALALKIMQHMDKITGNDEIKLVENEFEQIKGIMTYLNYDSIKNLDEAYQSRTIYTTVKGGAINRTISAYIEEIERIIESIE